MTLRHLNDLKAPIGDVLATAGEDGLLIEREGQSSLAVIPLDDDLLDYLLERNPKFRKECDAIRRGMRRGQSHAHEGVKRMLKD